MEYFPGSNTLQLNEEVKRLLSRLGETPEKFHRKNSIHVEVQRHFLCNKKAMKKNVWQMLDSYLCMKGCLLQDNGHSLVLVVRRSGTLSKKTVHMESGTKLRQGCCWTLQKADVPFSVLHVSIVQMSTQKQRTW